MGDAEKHIEKAEKFLAKEKVGQAIDEYKAAYAGVPNNLGLLQTLADLCLRDKRDAEANKYYAELFDKSVEKNDAARAIRVFARLQKSPQPAERHANYAHLLIKQRKNPEALKAYETAAGLFESEGKGEGLLDCLERMATLSPDTADIHVRLGEQAEKLGKHEEAAKGFLRAGQLVRPDDLDKAVHFFQSAHKYHPDRSTALNLGQVQADKGRHKEVAELLMPIYAESGTDHDPAILQTLGTALVEEDRLGEAEEVISILYDMQPDSYDLYFGLADHYGKQGNTDKIIEIVGKVKDLFVKAKREKEFGERAEVLLEANPTILPLGEFIADFFSSSNQENRYENALGTLFDQYCQAEDFEKAANTLDRLIDIDPYDFQNQDRLKALKGKLDQKKFRDIATRISADIDDSGETDGPDAGKASNANQSLEDMMVQAELFIQYNLRSKAIEKMKEISELFSAAAASNPRLSKLYDLAGVTPPAAPAAAPAAGQAPAAAPAPQGGGGGSVSDLAKISEITHAIVRKASPKEIVHTAVTELGKYLKASRVLGVLGRPGTPPSTAVEFCSPGVPQSASAAIVKLLEQVAGLNLDRDSGAVMDVAMSPNLQESGAQSVLAMPMIDTEKNDQEGTIILSQADYKRQWNPNEVYLVKAVADQAQAAISHIKLRSLMKNLSVAETGGGLLGRSVYLDTLVSVVGRSKKQGTPLVVALFELDKGGALTKQVGEEAVETMMAQAGESVLSQVRQTDLTFRYTGTALAVAMGDTTIAKCKPAVEKLRRTLCVTKLAGVNGALSFSVGASEADIRPDYEAEDIVSDVVNRAEFCLQAARKKGNAIAVG